MPTARRFKCAACGHEFEVPFCDGQRGRDMICPSCGQGPVRRAGRRMPGVQGGSWCRRGGWRTEQKISGQ